MVGRCHGGPPFVVRPVLSLSHGVCGFHLGFTLVLEGLHRLRAHGMDTAVLGTASEVAQALYESLGFRRSHQVLAYARDA
jgi:hypothetical protein